MHLKATTVPEVKLSEIFTSIEGEGILAGTKTLFIRLSGCPLRCHWCDTPQAIPFDSGTSVPIDKAKDLISSSLEKNTFKVNFTGGEPLAQDAAVFELANYVRGLGLSTYLESACHDSVRFKKLLPVIDFCKIEFKLSDAQAVGEKHQAGLIANEIACLEAACAERKAVYIKIVVTRSSSLAEFQDLVRRIFGAIRSEQLAGFIIQPSSTVDAPSLGHLFKFYDAVYPYFSQVRIIPQLHKILGAR